MTNSWTIAQIHCRVAKSRHLSKIAAGCQNRGNAASAILKISSDPIHQVITPVWHLR